MLGFSRTMTASGKGGPPRAGGPIGSAGSTEKTDRAASVGGVDRAGEITGPTEVEALSEIEATRATEVKAVGGVSGAKAAGAADPVASIAAALRAGELSVAEAVDRLIDDAVTRRVGRAVEPGGALEARLRRVLRDYASADPLITAKIRRLESRRSGR